MELEILYRDNEFVAINKPHGLLVHRSPIAADASEYALQILRDQLGQRVYPAHRIDRKTGGILLFALHENALTDIRHIFQNGAIEKRYLAIVRGYTADCETIDYPLCNDSGKVQESVTHYKTLQCTEVAVAHGKFSTSRYSLVEVNPQTGRMHQIRKHFAHIFHPIIGDRPHGCNKQNRLFLNQWNMNTMLLHAHVLKFTHPVSQQIVTINAPLQSEFARMIDTLGFINHTIVNVVSPTI